MEEQILEETKAYILGMLKAYNDVRISVWGFGYDDDKTGQMIRRLTTDKIYELKEILEIEYIGSNGFESVKRFIEMLPASVGVLAGEQ